MDIWEENDIRVSILKERMIFLKDKFDKKNKRGLVNYSYRLECFYRRHLKGEVNLILKQQVEAISFSLLQTESFK